MSFHSPFEPDVRKEKTLDLSVLIIEDNIDTVYVLKELLKGSFDISSVTTLQFGLKILSEKKFDAIILDLNLPDSSGMETLKTVLKNVPEIPVIVFTGIDAESNTIESIKYGAQDYLLKGQVNRDIILRTIRYAIERKKNELKLKEAIENKNATEYKLRESEEKYRTIVEYSNDLIWSIDKEGKYQFINKKAEKVSGYKQEELLGKPFMPLLSKEEQPKILDVFHRVLLGQVQQYELNFTNKYGKEIIVSANSAPIYSKGKIVGLTCFGRDITEQKVAEAKVVETNEKLEKSNKELEQFAYIASHDLQEPLHTISSFAELLEKRYKDHLDQDANDFIDYILSGTKRMQQMIDDLLSLSRVGTRGREFKNTNIKVVLSKALENLHNLIQRNEAIITIDNIINDIPELLADEFQIMQVFQNLIDNAIKFRKIEIPRVHINAKKEIRRENNKEICEWIFTIQDNGIGIDKKEANKLFIIFQRLHSKDRYPGTGIGLAICKKIINRHGGRIWFDSKVGEGSTFYFTIPCTKG